MSILNAMPAKLTFGYLIFAQVFLYHRQLSNVLCLTRMRTSTTTYSLPQCQLSVTGGKIIRHVWGLLKGIFIGIPRIVILCQEFNTPLMTPDMKNCQFFHIADNLPLRTPAFCPPQSYPTITASLLLESTASFL